MRTNSTSGSNSTATIWSVCGVGFAAMFFWYMGWLPISFESPETGTLASNAEGPAAADLGAAGGSSIFDPFEQTPQPDFGEADPVAFRAQSEPPVEEGATDAAQMFAPPVSEQDEPSRENDPPFRPPGSVAQAETERAERLFPRKGAGGETRVASTSTSFEVQRIGTTAGEERLLPVDGLAGESGVAPPELAEKLSEIDDLLNSDRRLVAHRELSTLYWVKPEWRPHLQQRIEETALSIYFSDLPHYMEPYEVQAGDNLQAIAKQYGVPWEYLVRLNRVDPKRIRPGQKLKVIKGPFSARIDLENFELTIHAHGYFVRSFPIGIGKGDSTPVGKFQVMSKLVNPTYFGDDGVIDANDPLNPLGERWIDIGDSYGIHGTIDPQSIGKAQSRGCIRLSNSDVEVVYDLLSVGSEVVIRK